MVPKDTSALFLATNSRYDSLGQPLSVLLTLPALPWMVKYSDVLASVLSPNQELLRLERSDASSTGVYESARIPVLKRVLNRGSGAGGFVLFEGGEISWRLKSKNRIRAPRSVSVRVIQNSKRTNKVVVLKDASHVYSPVVPRSLRSAMILGDRVEVCWADTVVKPAADSAWAELGFPAEDST